MNFRTMFFSMSKLLLEFFKEVFYNLFVCTFRPKQQHHPTPTFLFGHENSIFDSRIFLCTPAEINKSKNLWQKNSTRPNPSTWNQKSCRTKWFGNPRIHIAEEDKKVDDEDSRKLNTTKQKIKEEILTRPIKIKKGCWSTSLPDFTYVLCTLMTAIRWTSEPSHQFLWRQVTGWCGRQQHRNAHCPLKFDTNGIENDFPWWIYFE